MRNWVFGIFFLATFLAANADTLQDSITSIIQQRHPTDAADTWRALGPEAPQVIISMYQKSSDTYTRMRLLQGLGWFSDPQAASFLKDQAETAGDEVVRNAAIRTLGINQGAAETDFISKFLENPDPQTRWTAADTLKGFHDPRTDEILKAYLKKEKASWIVAKLNGNLPSVSSPLSHVSSSEDRIAPEFSGKWKGAELFPVLSAESGMKTEEVSVKLEIPGATSVGGELTVSGKKRFRLEHGEGKASRIQGVWAEVVGPSEKRVGERFSFEAELVRVPRPGKSDVTLVQLKAPFLGLLMNLRRE